ncbi:hypothetical protein [Dickeya oryzae]|uniref:hypothetical protein n=1 Tax=Dickeya oryzae TaxID=1240404 RepID=UPI003B968A28
MTAPKPPQEPNMSRPVPVNNTLPSELYGQTPSSEGKKGGSNYGHIQQGREPGRCNPQHHRPLPPEAPRSGGRYP